MRARRRSMAGREKAVETYSCVSGMPTSAATSPETAVLVTYLQSRAPETLSAKDAEESKGLRARRWSGAGRGIWRTGRSARARPARRCPR